MSAEPIIPAAPADTASHSPMHPRHEQTFPVFNAREIERLCHFGTVRRYGSGEKLFETGKLAPGMFIMLSGLVAITQRDGLGHVTPVVEQGAGQFLAELGQLSGRPALVDGTAEGDVEVLVIPTERISTLLVAEAEIGERIMRAMILRRVALIEDAHGGPILIGPATSHDTARLQSFLTRAGHPHHVLDPASDREAAELIARYSPAPGDLPLVVTPSGAVLRNPLETELARVLGLFGTPAAEKLFDVAVVGAGPAGLATAVYAASEGLSVVVLDARAFGGQAGASARIENYLGFPTGISGQALAGRAFAQAQKFGVEIMIPVEVKMLDCNRKDGSFGLDLEGGDRVRSRSVVVASGARYRRPNIENLTMFEGRGVSYWASPIEARLAQGQEVIIVGGGNSAGQAAVFLAGYASKVRIMVRSDGLAASMSRYLIDRIAATRNIELMTQTEIVALDGTADAGVRQVRWRDRKSGAETTADIHHVFLFAGADPATSWLEGCGVQVDRSGFVITGVASDKSRNSPVSLLESTVPGVFAVGDVRSGSVKRVGGAIGEGAQVVAALHRYLADAASPSL
jgi:thioredoxin reductase (NADPH)